MDLVLVLILSAFTVFSWNDLTKPVAAQAVDAQIGRVIKIQVAGGRTALTVALGTTQGIRKSWTAHVVDQSGTKVSGGEATVVRVERQVAIVTTTLSLATVRSTPYVLLSPP